MTEPDKSEDQTPLKSRSRRRGLGFLKGQFKIPDDFDTLCQTEIEEMFNGSIIEPPIDDERPTAVEPPRTP